MSARVHHRFEEQVRLSPRSVALVIGERSVTRDELNGRANQLAHHLRSLGVCREELVAVCCEQGVDLMVALLAILKAGAAYVPIDPVYPRQRIHRVLQQAGCRVMLTQQHLCRDIVPPILAHSVDAMGEDLSGNRTSIKRRLARGSRLLHLHLRVDRHPCISQSHRGLAKLCEWYSGADACGGPLARTLVVSSIGFDLTQKNLFETADFGGLLIFGGPRPGDLSAMEEAVSRHRPTRINCAPSAFEALKGLLLSDSLEMLVLGGEPVRARLAEEVTGRGVRIMNSYGPTECSDVAMYHLGFTPGWETIPLGQAIPNVDVRLLDDRMQPVEGPGVGELFIGGAGVGRGYVGRPDWSADTFIEDPSGGGSGRLYRTGDLARRAADGTLWYVGRKDDQVKIRGNRIELGEIETVLAGHPSVKSAAVATRESAAGDKQLAAFVVLRDGTRPSVTSLPRNASLAASPILHGPHLVEVSRRDPTSGASGKVIGLALQELARHAPSRSAGASSAPAEALLMEPGDGRWALRTSGSKMTFSRSAVTRCLPCRSSMVSSGPMGNSSCRRRPSTPRGPSARSRGTWGRRPRSPGRPGPPPFRTEPRAEVATRSPQASRRSRICESPRAPPRP
ncbi:MAG: amino acid adenylation domain-containing protein [Polyangiaceae bacterium]